MAFSPDGKKIVTGSSDSSARIWNADGSGTPVVLTEQMGDVHAVAFSPDGKKVVTGSADQLARVWTVGSEALLAALWNATTNCLTSEQRQELFLAAPAFAQQGYERCRNEVARRRGWPAAANLPSAR